MTAKITERVFISVDEYRRLGRHETIDAEDEAALMWIDGELELARGYARGSGKERVVQLLEIVRADLLRTCSRSPLIGPVIDMNP
jgi:hypothetical protein